MDRTLRDLVWRRANERCEYCQVSQEFDEMPFHIDHIISQKQRGPTTEGNLALSCLTCNTFKGPLTAIVIPESGKVVRLFNPRVDTWSEHFHWSRATLIGRTEVGQVTIDMLAINLPERVAFREELVRRKVFPPVSS